MSTLTATVDNQTVTWKDPKRYLWLLGLIVPILPFGAIREANRWGLDVFYWIDPI